MGHRFNVPNKIFLYLVSKEKIDLKELLKFIRDNFGAIPVEVKGIDFVKTQGLFFDYLATQRAFKEKVSAQTRNPADCHIIITDKLIATFDEFNKLHIRAAIFSYPTVISASGIVEGPAKPREYYIFKQKYSALGIWDIQEEKVKDKFRNRFIDYKDKRLTEVIKGYIAQALFFFLSDEPFCRLKSCRLFNSHWQEDLVYSQIKSARFCSKHKRQLSIIKEEINNARKSRKGVGKDQAHACGRRRKC